MKRLVIAGIVTAVVIGLAIMYARQEMSQTESTQTQPSKIKIITSFYPLYEFSKNIGGSKADISVFTPVGVEPHDWEPSTGNLVALKKSNMFVYNGFGMEPFATKLTDSGEYPNVLFVEASHGIVLESNSTDPHIWLDPVLAKSEVVQITNAMQKADPKNAQYYENNAKQYSVELDELDSTIKTGLASCKKDTIVTFHSAFSYFGKRYGIKIRSLSGIVPESEVTANDLKNLIDYIKKNNIKVIFAEDLVDPKLAQVLADEAGAQVLTLSPLEGITKEEQANNVSYLDKMKENLASIKEALDCT